MGSSSSSGSPQIKHVIIAVILLLALAWAYVLLANPATSAVAIAFLSTLSVLAPSMLAVFLTKTPIEGFSLTSTKIINGAIITTSISLCLAGALLETDYISPVLFAFLMAGLFASMAIVVVAVVVKEQGWQAIFPE